MLQRASNNKCLLFTDTGKLITWGTTDDLGQSYVTSGRHGETPESFPLPSEVSMVKAAAGWAHCVRVTGTANTFFLFIELQTTFLYFFVYIQWLERCTHGDGKSVCRLEQFLETHTQIKIQKQTYLIK
ncbi:putative regulator of chromosome condensation 1/beta-lactamase-inhibitor protein II [Helianthus annuus]|nr:putative regulator of chromosome condensation 1/beta-lactamase-inhibitor protein II [Helianthus annuus]